MERVIYVNIFDGPIPQMNVEVPLDRIRLQDGQLFIDGQRYMPQALGDARNKFVGFGFTEDGEPRVLMRWRGEGKEETNLWHWNDVFLVPVRKKESQ